MKKNVTASLVAEEVANALPNRCWGMSAHLMWEAGYESAVYVRGSVVSRSLSDHQPHAWLVLDGEIIDPEMPDAKLEYIPASEFRRSDVLRRWFGRAKV